MAITLSRGRRLVWNWANLLRTDTSPVVVDAATGETLFALEGGHDDMVRGAREIADQRLVSYSNDRTLKVWSLTDGRCLATLIGHTEYVGGFLIEDSDILLSCAADATLRRWSISTQQCLAIYRGPDPAWRCPAGFLLLDRTQRLVAAWSEGLVVFHLDDEQPEHLLPSHGYGPDITALDRTHFAALDSRAVRVWNAVTGTEVATLDGDWWGMMRCAPDRLVTREIALTTPKPIGLASWHPLSGEKRAEMALDVADICDWRPLPDKRLCVTTEDYRLLLLDADTLAIQRVQGVPVIRHGAVSSIDPKGVLFGTDQEVVRRLADSRPVSASFGRQHSAYLLHTDRLGSLRMPEQGWELADGRVLFPLEEHILLWDRDRPQLDLLGRAGIFADPVLAAIVGWTGNRPRLSLQARTGPDFPTVLGLRSPDTLPPGVDDSMIPTDSPLRQTLGNGDRLPLRAIVSVHEGRAISYSRSALRCWDVASGVLLSELADPTDWGPGYEIVRPFYDGRVIFTGGMYTCDNRITLWDGDRGLHAFAGNEGEVLGLQVLSDRSVLSWGDRDGLALRLWSPPAADR